MYRFYTEYDQITITSREQAKHTSFENHFITSRDYSGTTFNLIKVSIVLNEIRGFVIYFESERSIFLFALTNGIEVLELRILYFLWHWKYET